MARIKFNNKSGFTLLELMVVVVIVAILSTVAFVSYEKAKVKSRDTQRKMDLAKVSLALTGYFADNKVYTTAANFADVSTVWVSTLGIYLPSIPTDPSTTFQYKYKSDNGAQYKIYATSEGIVACVSNCTAAIALAKTKAGDYYDSASEPANIQRFQISSSATALNW